LFGPQQQNPKPPKSTPLNPQQHNPKPATQVWEFGDTFILILRGKPVDFLHIYHHSMTELLTWLPPHLKHQPPTPNPQPPTPNPQTPTLYLRVQLREGSAVAWVPIIANLAVHVLMCVRVWVCVGVGVGVWVGV